MTIMQALVFGPPPPLGGTTGAAFSMEPGETSTFVSGLSVVSSLFQVSGAALMSMARPGRATFTRDWDDGVTAGQTVYDGTHGVNGSLQYTLQNASSTVNARSVFSLLTSLTDFDLTVDFRYPTGAEAIGIFFRATQGTGDIASGYRVDVAPPFFRVLRADSGVGYTVLAATSMSGTPGLSTTMRVVATGSAMVATLTASHITSGFQRLPIPAAEVITDATYTQGDWGLLYFSNPTSTGPGWFDNLAVEYDGFQTSESSISGAANLSMFGSTV